LVFNFINYFSSVLFTPTRRGLKEFFFISNLIINSIKVEVTLLKCLMKMRKKDALELKKIKERSFWSQMQVEAAIGRVRFGFGSNISGQFDLLEKIETGRVGSIYMLCFFRSLIDFDWIEGDLRSDQVRSGLDRSGQFDFFLKNQIGLGSNSDRSDRFLRSDRVLPPLDPSSQHCRRKSIIFFFM
jgi:hypothetical protein